jgi:hypothetical protein
MKFIYETPSGVYRISQQKDILWNEVFSVNDSKPIVIYNISRYDSTLAAWNAEHPEAGMADYVIVHSEENIEDCFIWFHSYNIISRDEMNYQTRIFSEIASLLPLTDSK